MPDYMFSLESRLSPEQRAAVLRVQELAAQTVSNVYLVGGAVRDLISGMPIRDLDFALEGNPFRLARELEKGGAKILEENERLRQVELIFAGDADGSISATRDDVYHRPGTKPEIRWSTIMEDLRRRDFSVNAVAISLNPASRGLLLDPTNGLADLEKREIRALLIHSFTNQPVRLMRALRYAARMGFKLESRTQEWFELAMERGLNENIPPEDVGGEVRQLAREEKPAAILKAWETHGLIGAIHPQLTRRHPHYDALHRLIRVRDDMVAAGLRPRLFVPATRALLGRLKPREQSAALTRMGFRSAVTQAVLRLEDEARKAVKVLSGRQTAAPRDAHAYLEKMSLDLLAHILAEGSNSKALGKIRNFLYKWRPLRLALPSVATELEALGMPRGPKFEKVLEQLFQLQLLGKGRKPEERVKLLRKLAGIKEPPKKKIEEKKKKAERLSKRKPAGGMPEAAAAVATAGGPPGAARAAHAPLSPPGQHPAAAAKAIAASRIASAKGAQASRPGTAAKSSAPSGKSPRPHVVQPAKQKAGPVRHKPRKRR